MALSKALKKLAKMLGDEDNEVTKEMQMLHIDDPESLNMMSVDSIVNALTDKRMESSRRCVALQVLQCNILLRACGGRNI